MISTEQKAPLTPCFKSQIRNKILKNIFILKNATVCHKVAQSDGVYPVNE